MGKTYIKFVPDNKKRGQHQQEKQRQRQYFCKRCGLPSEEELCDECDVKLSLARKVGLWKS